MVNFSSPIKAAPPSTVRVQDITHYNDQRGEVLEASYLNQGRKDGGQRDEDGLQDLKSTNAPPPSALPSAPPPASAGHQDAASSATPAAAKEKRSWAWEVPVALTAEELELKVATSNNRLR